MQKLTHSLQSNMLLYREKTMKVNFDKDEMNFKNNETHIETRN